MNSPKEIFILLFSILVAVSSPFSSDFSSEFEAGPAGDSDFEISGPTLASSSLLTNAGLELTPDNFDRDENVNPRDLFSDDTPISKLIKLGMIGNWFDELNNTNVTFINL